MLALASLSVALPARLPADDTKMITIFEARQISVPVPSSWSFDESRDPHHGLQTVTIEDPGKEIVLQVTFFPDQAGQLSSRKGLEEQARRTFQPYLETSVEKEMQLTFVDAPDGMAVYTKFTDSKLDPKHIPEGEKLISVTGLRSWKGVYMMFTLLTDTTESKTYRNALEIVLSGIRQAKTPVAF